MTHLWNTFVVEPLTQVLVLLHGITRSYGLAIILLTVSIKLITVPLTRKQLQATITMQELQFELQALQERYGKDKGKLAAEQMKLSREKGINPMLECLPMLIQMPILNEGFLWLPNLAEPQNARWLLQAPWNRDWSYSEVYLVLPVLSMVTQNVLAIVQPYFTTRKRS
ncbi:MAG: YidC/Oxa1 family membrane protein insertase [Anaerolineae bacterium]|nr:YidC/Oxa1 family membrane protein insertase [Anaerolineae bacterium]